jgi:thioredoxin reductase (NADPH)
MAEKNVDVIIIGGGPAGLAAALYTCRAGLNTVLLEKLMPGGQAATTDSIENYPGFPERISGPELMARFQQQAERFGLEIENAEATGIAVDGMERIVRTEDGDMRAKVIIIATGSQYRHLDVPGEDRLRGRGVSYCATCDGPFFQNATIAVVGGGDTAVEESIYLIRFAEKLYLIHRRDQLRATRVVQERAFANDKIAFVWDTVVEEIEGEDAVSSLKLRNVKTGEISHLPVEGVFILIGTAPNTDFVKGTLDLDEKGYIITEEHTRTRIPGIYAAGDVQDSIFQQVATAAGEGVQAAMMAERYIAEHFEHSA